MLKYFQVNYFSRGFTIKACAFVLKCNYTGKQNNHVLDVDPDACCKLQRSVLAGSHVCTAVAPKRIKAIVLSVCELYS